MKLLIIAIDGLDPLFVEEFLPALPTFRCLRKECEWHRCICEAPNTVTGFSSIYTGLSVQEHGLTGWDDSDEECGWLGLANRLKNKGHGVFWDLLNVAGFSVGLFNPPLVWPAEIRNGWCVAGFPSSLHWWKAAPGKKEFPDRTLGLYSSPEIAALAPPRYTVDAQDYVERSLTQEDRRTWYSAEIKALAHLRLRFALQAFSQLPVDIGFVCFTILDRIKHALHYLSLMQELNLQEVGPEIQKNYELVDYFIHRLLDEIKPEAFLICGDHGLNFSEDKCTLEHTELTLAFAGGPKVRSGQVADKPLASVFFRIFELLDVAIPAVGATRFEEPVFSAKDQEVARKKLEGLGYL